MAIRGALDWTADTKWAAASALNCENKYWIGLRCASQALSPIVICLGVHTGGSVCFGLKPLHVVAAGFFSGWVTLFEGAFNKTGCCWIWGARIQTHFCTRDNFPLVSAFCPCQRWELHKQSLSRRLVETFVSELKERSGVRGCGPLRGRRQTKHLGQVDLDVWTLEGNLFSGQCSVSSQRLGELTAHCCPLHGSFKQRVRTAD